MTEELTETLEELFRYFELDQQDWPLLSVYSQGEYISGVIDDELFDILSRLKVLSNEEE